MSHDTITIDPVKLLSEDAAPKELLPEALDTFLSAPSPSPPTPIPPVTVEPEFVSDETVSKLSLDAIFERIPKEDTVILIDGANIGSTTDRLGFSIDYKKFVDIFFKYTGVYATWYFNGMPNDDNDSSTRQKVEAMEENNIRIFTKPIKKINTAKGMVSKANMDVEIVCTALEHCQNAKHIVLMSGDGDFRYLVETLRRRDIVVTIISTKHISVMAAELRRVADRFIDLVDLKPYIAQ